MINISFAITVCNEAAELKRLLNQLNPCAIEGDEVVIQVDTENTTQSVLDIISDYDGVKDPVINSSNTLIAPCTKLFFNLNKDFSSFKNHLLKNCNKDYIFQIDADEEVTQDQIHLIREILEMNPDVDCFAVPRLNTVAGMTQEDIGMWGWRVDDKGRVNWPDFQHRILKNTGNIYYTGKVHERLEGYKQLGSLPIVDILALGHHKTIERQRKQNNFYNTI